jgi:HAD superfamily hydrolase (TIGR01549 family)
MLNNLKAIIFDLDGTLVDSGLDFALMRKELSFPENTPILEHLETIENPVLIQQAHEVIHKHELAGANNSTIYPGVKPLLEFLEINDFKIGIQTRNSDSVTDITLRKFGIKNFFHCILTRDNCEPKPMPTGILKMLANWKIDKQSTIFIGDYLFDIETAENANVKSGLYLNNNNEYLKDKADYTFSCYNQLLQDLGQHFHEQASRKTPLI